METGTKIVVTCCKNEEHKHFLNKIMIVIQGYENDKFGAENKFLNLYCIFNIDNNKNVDLEYETLRNYNLMKLSQC